MEITKLCYDPNMANTFVLGEENAPCIVFDLGLGYGARVQRFCQKRNMPIVGLFLTHGHYDHIAGLNELDETFDAPVFLHAAEEDFLFDAHLNGSELLFGEEFTLKRKTGIYRFEDEDEIKVGAHREKDEQGNEVTLGGIEVQVIHTPFHTPGSACFYVKQMGALFAGDTLFHGSIGRSDLPGGQPRLIPSSLSKLEFLPDDTKVYCGHGPSTTLGAERRYNPYLKS